MGFILQMGAHRHDDSEVGDLSPKALLLAVTLNSLLSLYNLNIKSLCLHSTFS